MPISREEALELRAKVLEDLAQAPRHHNPRWRPSWCDSGTYWEEIRQSGAEAFQKGENKYWDSEHTDRNLPPVYTWWKGFFGAAGLDFVLTPGVHYSNQSE